MHKGETVANGISLNRLGYNIAAHCFWDEPWAPANSRFIEIDFAGGTLKSEHTKISNVMKDDKTLRWTQLDERLPSVAEAATHFFTIESPHSFEVRVDGRPLTSERGAWLRIYDSLSVDQLEKLRQAIVKKNALFFHRWRPANETYLYGFRKHEQGNNGVEPPMFDKLVEQAEGEIAVLKKPVPHKYELIRVEEKK